MKKVLANIRVSADMGGIRREKRNGRDKIIVPSATLPDDVIMNGIKYPADEIEKSFASLNGTIAPLGHPSVDGKFVSASHPEGINIGWVGAHNENVRRENGRVFLDKVIDVQRANESDGGKAVLAAIEKGDPIHTSTGVFLELDETPGDGYTSIARNMLFDHDAILLTGDGAATPNEGVGMMVNSSGEETEINVINSTLEDAERDLDWAIDHLARALERRERVPVLERMKSTILEAFGLGQKPNFNEDEEDDEMADENQIKELTERVNALSDSVSGIGAVITEAVNAAMAPVVEAQATLAANQEAKDKADHDVLVNKVVDSGIEGIDKAVAEKLDGVALNAMLSMHEAQNKKAAPLASGFMLNSDSDDVMSPLGWGAK